MSRGSHTFLSGLLRAASASFLTGFLLVLAGLAPSAHAQSAGTWNSRGQKAELHENYDEAYEDYLKAHNKNLKDIRYKTRLERMRFQAAVQHIDRARVLRAQGDYTGALTNLMRAAEIDPANQTAQQEIIITQQQQPAAQPSPAGAAAAAAQQSDADAVMRRITSISGPVELKPVSNDPITLHMVEDVKVIYQAVGKLAGLNVLFDPEYTSKRIPVDLTNVTLADAFRIIGTISGTFYKPVTSNTVFVAQNTRTKRTDLDELAVQTFYLANSSQANDGNEVLTGLRLLLDPSVKLYFVASQNCIVMRGTSDELLLAQKLINDFDRARPEVVVDVAVLEVNRDKIRNLGITLPTSIGITPQATSTTTTGTAAAGTQTTTQNNFTLNSLAHLNANNFGVTLSGGTLNALLSDSDTRILQNPRIRATDGQRATLKIGSKIPIATGSYNAGVSTGVASIGVQTQFTYLDVGVNIDMTPTVHYDREISLKLKIEVSSQSGSVTLSNVTEPIISQRVIEQVIQLAEGEPSILAGIITRQDNHTTNGTPGLGELPFFKYFFSSQNKETQQDEIVFLLIPHIVRESVLSRLNLAAIDTGTGGALELRHKTQAEMDLAAAEAGLSRPRPGTPTTAANAAGAALQQLHEQAQPTTQPAPGGLQPANLPTNAASATPEGRPNTQPLAPVAPNLPVVPPNGANAPPPGTPQAGSAFEGGSPVSLSVLPASAAQTVGSTFQTSIMLQGGRDIFSVPMQVQFDPKVLQLVNVDAGDFLAQGGQSVSMVHRDEGNGLVTISSSRPPAAAGVNGQGTVVALTFKAIAAGDSTIALVKVGAKNSAQTALPAVGSPGIVHVK